MRFKLIHMEEFLGAAAQRDNVSGIVLFEHGRRAAICTDEGALIIVLDKTREHTWEVSNTLSLLADDAEDAEADLESLAVDHEWLYAIGSYAARRKRVRPDKSRKENRKRLEDYAPQPSRRVLARIRREDVLEPTAKVERDKGRLWKAIKRNVVLAPFRHIPSKENGVDIEGLAVDGADLLVGFRGPVLRGNYALAMRTRFAARRSELLYLDLGGRGIRDLCRIGRDRFFVLAGPNGDQPLSYELYEWNGRDGMAGSDLREPEVLEHIGTIPTPQGFPGARPEGIDVVQELPDRVTIVVVYDTVSAGRPTLLEIAPR